MDIPYWIRIRNLSRQEVSHKTKRSIEIWVFFFIKSLKIANIYVYGICLDGNRSKTYMTFKSYCWVIGTTSFRVKQLSYKNELQLTYLSELFLKNKEKPWRELQEKYYDLLVSKGFSGGTAKNKAKDARELTSGLGDLGLVYKKTRHITPVGDMLYSISQNDDFKSDNLLDISKDSYVYLLQFLKYQIWDENTKIKPFVSLIYMLSELGSLTRDEFTYLLPICMNISDVLEGVKFALSNMIKHKGLEHTLLEEWVKNNGFNLIKIKSDYSNSNYHIINNKLLTEEVLITNY